MIRCEISKYNTFMAASDVLSAVIAIDYFAEGTVNIDISDREPVVFGDTLVLRFLLDILYGMLITFSLGKDKFIISVPDRDEMVTFYMKGHRVSSLSVETILGKFREHFILDDTLGIIEIVGQVKLIVRNCDSAIRRTYIGNIYDPVLRGIFSEYK